jgi:endonuclease-3
VLRFLDERYPPLAVPLTHTNPWELLVAVILSAQCTDARVNTVTPALFAAYPTPQAMAGAPLARLEALVKPTGFYRNKAANLKACALAVATRHGGSVPATMAELVALPGVGRKTANVILHAVHDRAEGIVVDTHIFRVSRRTGAATGETPEQVERELMAALPRASWKRYGDVTIQHGRVTCHARKPACQECPLATRCPSSLLRPAAARPPSRPATQARGQPAVARARPAARR